MAKYKVTTSAGIETIEATKIELESHHLLMLASPGNVVSVGDVIAIFAPGQWSTVIREQPDTFGDATKAVS